jgi:hypothetical protein
LKLDNNSFAESEDDKLSKNLDSEISEEDIEEEDVSNDEEEEG